jgi:hypothetical protein
MRLLASQCHCRFTTQELQRKQRCGFFLGMVHLQRAGKLQEGTPEFKTGS